MKYIAHNQWSGDNKFIEFYHRVLTEEWDKIIIFCQNEWEWYNHEPTHWKLLQEHCKRISKPIHVIVGAAEKDFPVHIDNVVVTYWATAWFGRTYTNAIRNNSSGIFIDPLDDAEYTHHYFNFNHRAKSHRCKVIDQLAKHDILKNGKVSIHDAEVYSGHLHEEWRKYNWKYFKFTPLEVDHEEFTANSHSLMFAVTDVHKKSFCQLVSETTDRSYFISEKTIMPLCAGKPFLVASKQGYHKMLVDLGFVLYDEIFDYSFDEIEDDNVRYEMLVNNYKRLCEIPLSELPAITRKLSNKLIHNKNRVREIVYDRSFQPDLVKEILAHYNETGEEVDHLLCSLHNEEEYFNTMASNVPNYIGHNQWDGLNFTNFYNKAISGNYEKVILFCQNEWEWHEQADPELFSNLLSFCKSRNQPLYIISGSAELHYPAQVENTEVLWWDTYWIGKTLGALCHISKGQKLSIDPYQNVDYKYHFISMNNRPHSHRCLLIDLLAKNNLLEHGAVSMHGTPVIYTYRYFDGRPLILEPEFAEDKNQYRIVDQYYESFAQLVSESSSNTIILSEKTAIPLLLGKPFLVASQMHYHKFLKSLGFELYEELFDYSFDDEPDEEKRYEMLLENFKKLVKIDKQDLYILRMQIANKVAFNKKHARALAYDKSLYPKIAVEAINWYEDTGNILDRHLIDDYENLKVYRDYEI